MKHAESSLQIAAVRWFRTQYPQYSKLLIAIPNHAVLSGDAVKRARQWKRLEAEGAVTGAADLQLLRPSNDFHYYACFFEFKTYNGRQSLSQKEFQYQVESYYEYVVIRDIESFISKVKEYM